MRFFEQARMDYIDEFLGMHGFINRGHLIKKFGISMPQASHDLTKYKSQNPDKIFYNASAKRYEARRELFSEDHDIRDKVDALESELEALVKAVADRKAGLGSIDSLYEYVSLNYPDWWQAFGGNGAPPKPNTITRSEVVAALKSVTQKISSDIIFTNGLLGHTDFWACVSTAIATMATALEGKE